MTDLLEFVRRVRTTWQTQQGVFAVDSQVVEKALCHIETLVAERAKDVELMKKIRRWAMVDGRMGIADELTERIGDK